MGPATKKYLEILETCSLEAQVKALRVMHEYGIGHRDLTDDEMYDAGLMLAKIVNDDKDRTKSK